MSVLKGKIKPALPTWPMGLVRPEKWSLDKLCKVAKQLKVEAIEVVTPEDCAAVKKQGLVSALTVSHWFTKGYNCRKFWAECTAGYRKAIDANAACGFKTVISFWGFEDSTAEGGEKVSLEQGKKNMIEGYKQIIGYAEKKGQTLVLEPLNSRDPADWKGHPGYQGANIEDCMEVIRAVGSPSLKLLFDFYHVQIMNGDIIRRIGQYREHIGYVQAAGVPGRHELDGTQELNFPAILKAFVDNGYRGYVGLEFIPAQKNALASLKAAVKVFHI